MRHKGLALAWALVVCLLVGHNAWLWVGQRIVPDTDILALLPSQERDKVLQASFTKMVDAAQQRVVVLVGAPGWDDARRAADAYSAVLAKRPDLLGEIKADANVQADWLSSFDQHRLVLMSGAQEAQLRSESPQFWAENALARVYGAFSGPKLGAFRDDPFGLFAGWMQERAQETPVRPRDGYLYVADGELQYVLLPMTLKVPAFSMGGQGAVVPLLGQAADAARAAVPGARVISAGVVLHAAAAANQANTEVHTIGAGSLIGIVLLTWLVFRSLKPIVLVLLSIGIGFLGALSVSMAVFGNVHLLTLVFGASLIGVAQDYGIYFLCNRLSADPALDSRTLLRRLLPGLALTLLAAVIGYLGLGFTPFPGLRQMAVFSAVGLVFAWLTVICWFPPLVDGRTLKRGRLAGWYGAALAHWPRVRPTRAWLAAAIAFAAFAIAGGLRLGTNDDIRSLQNPPKQLIADQVALGRLLDAPTPVQYFLVRASSPELVLQREETLKRALDPLVAKGSISGYQAISNWVPSAATQAGRRELAEAKLLGEGGGLGMLAEAIGEDKDWVAATRAHLLAAGKPLTVDAFLRAPSSEPWRHLWLGEMDGTHASVVALRGLAYASMPAVRDAGAGIEGVQWVDKVGEISSVLGRYRQYMGVVLVAAYALVFALLYPRYRADAWRVLAPTALATVAALALFGLAGHPLQLFHVLALMLVLGVGVDYGIFMQEHGGRGHATPWLAVGLSAANTLLGFGLLGLSNTPALRAFGLTMLIGIALVWLAVPCFTKPEGKMHVDQA
ncbi:MAG TPA: MMPL family transporter [Telluria sp.]